MKLVWTHLVPICCTLFHWSNNQSYNIKLCFGWKPLVHATIFIGELVTSKSRVVTTAPIAVDGVIPDSTLGYSDEKDKLQQASVPSLAAGKKVIIFCVLGAFTPICNVKHVLSFIESWNQRASMKRLHPWLHHSRHNLMHDWTHSYPSPSVHFLRPA